MDMTREEIIQLIEENRETLRGFGVTRLGLFGSAARGELTSKSDLDFLVELERKTFDAYMDAKFFLEDLFGIRVDLVLADGIKPRLKPYIEKDIFYVPGL